MACRLLSIPRSSPDEEVVGGGGDEMTLIKVKVRDIIEVNKAIVADISK
jgi:prolyl-tRNA editing enzyme YbaK/EbsC (Cys-tRNA(Pro) deacylase)